VTVTDAAPSKDCQRATDSDIGVTCEETSTLVRRSSRAHALCYGEPDCKLSIVFAELQNDSCNSL
jgi:hypothetical protein